MDQAQWAADGADAGLTLIQSDQQFNSVTAGQGLYAYEVQGLGSAVGGGYVVQLPDGTTTFVSADSVIATTPEVQQVVAAPEPKPSTKRSGNRQSQVNGGNRQEQTSLLNTRKEKTQTSKSSGGAKHHQVSLLQTNWQQHIQEQPAVDVNELNESAIQLQLTQQQANVFADSLSEVKPNEKVYVSIDGVTYEIVTDETGQQYAIEASAELAQQGAEIGTLQSESTGIGLAELATLSAERETLELTNYQTGVADGTQVMVSQEQSLELAQAVSGSQLQSGEQHYLELVPQSQENSVTTEHDAMQVYLVPGEGEHGVQNIVVSGSGLDGKQNVGDLVFQNDPQFQEMVAKGFDLSNCHIVIQEDGQPNGTVYMAAPSGGVVGNYGQDLQQQLVSVINSSGYITTQASSGDGLQSVSYVNGAGASISPNNVLTILADPSTLQQHQAGDGQQKSTWSAVAPEEFDDGEFDYLKQDTEALLLNGLIANDFSSKSLPIDRCLTAYRDFINGNKVETLSSVANSTVSKRPQLPKYEPDLFPRPVRDKALQPHKGSLPMTVVYTNESGSIIQKINSRSILKTNAYAAKRARDDGDSPLVADTGMQLVSTKTTKLVMDKEGKIIKRKRRGSDEDSYDDSDSGEIGGDIDPSWKPGVQGQKSHASLDLVQPTPSRGRGRGRPRGSGRGGRLAKGESQRSVDMQNSSFTPIDLNEPHSYQKGDFVIERKDRYKFDGFPVWKIESGRLLQKYDPFFSDTGVLHKSVSIYSSWSGDVRTNFKAIMVEIITTTGRKCEIVKVHDSCLPKAPDDSLEKDALMELFNVYFQVLVSQAIDPNFFASIEQSQESYYLSPVEQIDNLLVEAEQAVLSQICWNEKFKAALDERPFYKITEPQSDTEQSQTSCQASVDGTLSATKFVKFYGPHYDRKSLDLVKDAKVLASQDFTISQLAADHLATYHGLHHFKFHLYKRCQEEVQFVKQTGDGRSDSEILEDCLKNRIFVQQGLRELKTLLENCSIVITVVTKPEETNE